MSTLIIFFSQFLPTMLSDDIMKNYSLTTPSDSYSYESGTDASLIQAFSIAFRYNYTCKPILQFSMTSVTFSEDDRERKRERHTYNVNLDPEMHSDL